MTSSSSFSTVGRSASRATTSFSRFRIFLRKRQRLTGTKVVCAEGDCGSCAVFVGRPSGEGMRYGAVTSCIQLVFQLDGAHVVTIEGLRRGRELNPIQQAMVDCQGTQCGFCTPGFVVALYDLMQQEGPLDAHAVQRGLVGNLCRCTGYDSITRAALATDRAALPSLDALYPPKPIVEALSAAKDDEVRVTTPTGRLFVRPTDLRSACRFRAEHPDCLVVAGATDLGVVYNKRMRLIDRALSIGNLAELSGITLEQGAAHAGRNGNGYPVVNRMRVGAATPLSELERASLAHLPELGKFLAWFGSPLIKNAGTIGGNIVTGSPIGDTLPALMALDAEVEIAGPTGRRHVPIQAFYTGYRKTVLASDELVAAVRMPLLGPGESLKLYKVSRRKDLDISTFSAAIWIKEADGVIADVRIFFGGVGPMVLRMKRAEDALRGAAPTLEAFEEAGELAGQDVTPITDVRGSEVYRRTLAENILVKFWNESPRMNTDQHR